MSNDWSQECVVKQCDDCSRSDIWLEHCVVNLRLIEEPLKFVIGIFPNDVGVALAVEINCRPVAVLSAHGDDVIIDCTECSIVTCRAIHWSRPRVENGVDDFVLAGFVSPNDVDSIHLIDDHVWVPNLVKSWIGDLSGVNERLAPR